MGSKYIIVSVLVLVGYISSQAKSDKLNLEPTMSIVPCLEEAGMTFEQLKEQINDNSHEALCVLKCSYVKAGALDKDGNVDVNLVWTTLEKHGLDNPEIKNKFTKCLESAGKILICDDAVKHAKCFHDLIEI
ncbi:uncharacterized protein [Diabrotica undecimpunctata]|uniref:uncharacterized protein n=1 Tax=Diabrotica undecimpunctata TaxID=50387 RepID=UPI003B636434